MNFPNFGPSMKFITSMIHVRPYTFHKDQNRESS